MYIISVLKQRTKFDAKDKEKIMQEHNIYLPEDCGINISTVDSYYENDYGVLNDNDLNSLFDDPEAEEEEDEE